MWIVAVVLLLVVSPTNPQVPARSALMESGTGGSTGTRTVYIRYIIWAVGAISLNLNFPNVAAHYIKF